MLRKIHMPVELRWYEANEVTFCERSTHCPGHRPVKLQDDYQQALPSLRRLALVEHAHNIVNMVNAAVMLSLVAIKIDSSMTRPSGFWCNKTLDTRKVL